SPREHAPDRIGVDATRDCAHHAAELSSGPAVVLQRDGHDHGAGAGDGNPKHEALGAIELDRLPPVPGEPQVDACQVARSICLNAYRAHLTSYAIGACRAQIRTQEPNLPSLYS